MKIRALINYYDKQLGEDIKVGTVYEVSEARGKEIINAISNDKHYAEEVIEEKAVVETTTEKAVAKRTTRRTK